MMNLAKKSGLCAMSIIMCLCLAVSVLAINSLQFAAADDLYNKEQIVSLFQSEDASVTLSDGGLIVKQSSAISNNVFENGTEKNPDEGANQTTVLKLKDPLYLADNTKNDVLLELDIRSISGISGASELFRDTDAIIISLTDTKDPSNYISILLAAIGMNGGSYSRVQARASGQKFYGYRNTTNNNANIYENNQSDKAATAILASWTDTGDSVKLYYDNTERSLFVSPAHGSYRDAEGNIIGNNPFLVRDFRGYGWDKTVPHAKLTEEDEPSWNKGFETAYLTITAVRKLRDSGNNIMYDDFGERLGLNYASKNFRNRGTLSNEGCHYTIKEIDGQSFIPSGDGVIHNSVYNYYADGKVTAGKAPIPAVKKVGVLSGAVSDPDFTSNLFIKVTKGNETIPTYGTNNGKWQEECYFLAEEDGTYTIGYYKDSEFKNLICEGSIKAIIGGEFEFSEGIGEISEEPALSVNDSNLYSGLKIETMQESSVAYLQGIEVSEMTAENKLFEFIFLPEQIGSFDFWQLTLIFTDAENENNKMTVSLRHNNASPGKLTSVSAAGSDQKLLGKRSIRDTYGEGEFATPLAVGFEGEGYKGLKNSSVALYYDNEQGRLYASPEYNQKSNTVSEAKQLVRDFRETDLHIDKIYAGDYPDQADADNLKLKQSSWAGFTSGKVNLEIRFSEITENHTAGILVTAVGGRTLTKHVYCNPAESDGVVGYSYPLPAPQCYDKPETGLIDFYDNGGKVEVEGPDGRKIFISDNVFVPKTPGKYTAYYTKNFYGTDYVDSFTFQVFDTETAPQIDIVVRDETFDSGVEVYAGSALNVAVTAKTALYCDSSKDCDVVLEVKKDGVLQKTFTAEEIGKEFCYFTFENAGDYEFIYTATDYVGRTQTEVYTISVVRTAIESAGNEWMFELGEQMPQFSENDIKIYDISSEAKVELNSGNAVISVKITVKFGEEEFVDYTTSFNFGKCGEYYIKYAVTYSLLNNGETGSGELIRKIEVRDTVAPEFEDTVPISGNLKEDTSYNSTKSAVYLKAKSGTQITIGKLSAFDRRGDSRLDLSENVKTFLISPNGEKKEIVIEGASPLTLERGIWYIWYEINDDRNLTKKIFSIDVRDEWYAFSEPTISENYEVNTEINLPVLEITDFNGSIAKIPVEIKIFYGLNEIEVQNGKFTPKYIGNYKIFYSASANGEQISSEVEIDVKDTQKPIISTDAIKTEGYTGEYFYFTLPVATDNYDTYLSVAVSLIDGTTVTELSDLFFIPEKAGEYKLRFTCEDSSGNSGIAEVTIKIEDRTAGCGCNGIIAGKSEAFPLIVLILSGMIIVMCLRKARSSKNK